MSAGERMSMHKVHFINGKEEIFFNIISDPNWHYYIGYLDSSCDKSVTIPLTSVLYVERMK